ncbi:MAG TPA: hypothetical protein VMB74_18415 [Streptosporangiaceae bacterium]|nr:hypothetical protein [Streptosporangiaceae bacterium]
MFARRELQLELGFETARARLVNLIRDGALAGASHSAYDAGIAAVIRVGPLGTVPGAGKLVRVSFLDPADRDGRLQVGLRWEATGIASDLFPVLDGDITLTAVGPGTSRLALAGVYRPPLGRLGARLDAAILHGVADATFSALLRSVADTLVSPVSLPAGPAIRAADPTAGTSNWPAPEPGAT